MANLTQTGINIVAGQTYTLSFDVDITAGVIQAYQGTQLIYDGNVLRKSMVDTVVVSENISIKRRSPISKFDAITISDVPVILIPTFKPSVFDSISVIDVMIILAPSVRDQITVSESVAISVV